LLFTTPKRLLHQAPLLFPHTKITTKTILDQFSALTAAYNNKNIRKAEDLPNKKVCRERLKPNSQNKTTIF
jgi:hypothetical protein